MNNDQLAAIEARAVVAMDYPGAVTIEQSQADVPDLLAIVREQRAAIERVRLLCDYADDYGLRRMVKADAIRAALTATEGA
jgi:hypothetical protein